ncbi:MAG: glycosyltransferase [Kiritimatiellales bacterium]|nr:glycosyltransferase [Kiritimatiellales bacterium]
MQSRADLHVHSKYSDRPSEWFLRRIGSPESFVEPLALYRTCRERGMDYVTITDHNSIKGALEIGHLPGTFLSSELTTYFPENNCKVHCLVWGITEKTFNELDVLRPSIYDLHRYMNEHHVVHAIAHPLFAVNDRLTLDQFEKLILMFKRFEGLNGSRHPRAGTLARTVFENLTPELIVQLANKHNLAPTGSEPWKKFITGGSDDHSGLYTAEAHTVTPHASTVFDFLQNLNDGRHQPGGRAGTSVRLAHSLYGIAYSYYENRFLKNSTGKDSLVGAMLKRLVEEPKAPETGLRATLSQPIRNFVFAQKKKQLNEIEKMLLEEITAIRRRSAEEPPEEGAAFAHEDDRKFKAACRIGQQLTFTFIQRFIEQIRRGGLIESIQSFASLGPVALGIAPYLTAFSVQHKDEPLIREVAARFPGTEKLTRRSAKRAWFTDTFTDMNGVVNTIRTLATLAHKEGREITVVTCLPEKPEADFPLKNFRPVGTFQLPEYQQQELVYPPVLEIINWLEQEEIDEIIISTPGPMGLAALAAARLLKLKVRGIYHTDFPQYVRHLADDEHMEDLTWRYMSWFYETMNRIAVPSKTYLEQLVDKGFAREKLYVMSRGVDLERFSPEKRDETFWHQFNLNGEFKFFYAGRISKEKNLVNLLDAFRSLNGDDSFNAKLILAGDGPDLIELKQEYSNENILFTGRLSGEELSQAYASADFFVFPSLTDTFGNAVLEAHACGLPAIVSEEGGPCEIVRSHNSGLVVNARSSVALAEALRTVRRNDLLRGELKKGALARARASRWETVLAQL